MKKSVIAEMKVLIELPVSESTDEMSLLESAYKVDDSIVESLTIVIENIFGEKMLVKVKDWNTDMLGLYDEFGNLVG